MPADPAAPFDAPPRVAAFFDLDKTIIAGSSALAFSRPFRREGLISRRVMLRGAYSQLLLVLSGADASTMDTLRRRLTALCEGWEVDQVRAIVAETLDEIVRPMVYAEATALIERHRAAGEDVVVLSASGQEVVEPIAALVGADRAVATRMAIRGGRYAGEIEFYCYGEEKAAAARRLADEHGYDLTRCHAYTDSITDLPLLEAVGHPVVVNPDRELRRIARTRDWPVRTFAHPVPVRARLRSRSVVTVAAGACAALALTGAGWFSARSRRAERGER